MKLVNVEGTAADVSEPRREHHVNFFMTKGRLFDQMVGEQDIALNDGSDIKAVDINLMVSSYLTTGRITEQQRSSIFSQYEFVEYDGDNVEDVLGILQSAEALSLAGDRHYQVPVMAGKVDGKLVLVYDRASSDPRLTVEEARGVMAEGRAVDADTAAIDRAIDVLDDPDIEQPLNEFLIRNPEITLVPQTDTRAPRDKTKPALIQF